MKAKQPTEKDVNLGTQISNDIENAIFEILIRRKPDPRIGISAIMNATIKILRTIGQCLDTDPDEYVVECLNIGIRAVRGKVNQPNAEE